MPCDAVQDTSALRPVGRGFATLAPGRGAASGKSLNASEPCFLLCGIKKIQWTRMSCF